MNRVAVRRKLRRERRKSIRRRWRSAVWDGTVTHLQDLHFVDSSTFECEHRVAALERRLRYPGGRKYRSAVRRLRRLGYLPARDVFFGAAFAYYTLKERLYADAFVPCLARV